MRAEACGIFVRSPWKDGGRSFFRADKEDHTAPGGVFEVSDEVVIDRGLSPCSFILNVFGVW
jgi:hypothetical protein